MNNQFAFVLTPNTQASRISFSTFVDARWTCGDGPVIVSSSNNIIVNTTASAPIDTVTGTACDHQYVLMRPQASSPVGANNLLNVDPVFASGATADFNLLVGSPAIDAAHPAATEMIDFGGNARPHGARSDIGALEHRP